MSRISEVTENILFIKSGNLFTIQNTPLFAIIYMHTKDFPGGSYGKVSACNLGDLGSVSESERSPGEGNGNPLQYSYLQNPMDRGAR